MSQRLFVDSVMFAYARESRRYVCPKIIHAPGDQISPIKVARKQADMKRTSILRDRGVIHHAEESSTEQAMLDAAAILKPYGLDAPSDPAA